MSDWIDIRMDRPNLDDLPPIEIPEGYELTTAAEWNPPDLLEQWLDLLAVAFTRVGRRSAEAWEQHIVSKPQYDPRGVFFILHEGEPVATAFAWIDRPDETEWGRVHWVASHPDHRGRQLGRAVTVAVMHHLKARGFPRVFLETQDFRVPAVRVYARLGFYPVWDCAEHERLWAPLLPLIDQLRPV